VSRPITQSEIKSFRRCRQQYYYRYVEELVPLTPPLKMYKGTVVHSLLEAHDKQRGMFSGSLMRPPVVTVSSPVDQKFSLELDDPTRDAVEEVFHFWHTTVWEPMPQEVKEALCEEGPFPEQCLQLVQRYIEYVKDREKEEEVLFSELELELGKTWKGRVDLVYRRLDTGELVIRDYKTTSIGEPKPSDKIRDMQLILYAEMFHKLHPEVDRASLTTIEWQFLNTQPPATPKWNKDGKLSKRQGKMTRKSAVSTITEKLHQLVKDGTSKEDAKILGHLWLEELKDKIKDEEFFQRRQYPFMEAVRERILGEAKETAREILAFRKEPKPIRTPDRSCDWGCGFSQLCVQELLGYDTQLERKKFTGTSRDWVEEQL